RRKRRRRRTPHSRVSRRSVTPRSERRSHASASRKRSSSAAHTSGRKLSYLRRAKARCGSVPAGCTPIPRRVTRSAHSSSSVNGQSSYITITVRLPECLRALFLVQMPGDDGAAVGGWTATPKDALSLSHLYERDELPVVR